MIVRLHIITGTGKSGRSTAAFDKQTSEPAANWLICDGITAAATVDSYLSNGRNVIWVADRVHSEKLEVTTSHCVALPKTFGSSVLARVMAHGPVRRFVLSQDPDGELSWFSKDGVAYQASDLIEPVVSFVAEEV